MCCMFIIFTLASFQHCIFETTKQQFCNLNIEITILYYIMP